MQPLATTPRAATRRPTLRPAALPRFACCAHIIQIIYLRPFIGVGVLARPAIRPSGETSGPSGPRGGVAGLARWGRAVRPNPDSLARRGARTRGASGASPPAWRAA